MTIAKGGLALGQMEKEAAFLHLSFLFCGLFSFLAYSLSCPRASNSLQTPEEQRLSVPAVVRAESWTARNERIYRTYLAQGLNMREYRD